MSGCFSRPDGVNCNVHEMLALMYQDTEVSKPENFLTIIFIIIIIIIIK